jgi:hypothetical protein
MWYYKYWFLVILLALIVFFVKQSEGAVKQPNIPNIPTSEFLGSGTRVVMNCEYEYFVYGDILQNVWDLYVVGNKNAILVHTWKDGKQIRSEWWANTDAIVEWEEYKIGMDTLVKSYPTPCDVLKK